MLMPREKDVLLEALSKHRPILLTLINHIGIIPLSSEQRENIREALADELVETGLDENDEPNSKGLLLEHIIDRLGHL